jgi:hypothetical protein
MNNTFNRDEIALANKQITEALNKAVFRGGVFGTTKEVTDVYNSLVLLSRVSDFVMAECDKHINNNNFLKIKQQIEQMSEQENMEKELMKRQKSQQREQDREEKRVERELFEQRVSEEVERRLNDSPLRSEEISRDYEKLIKHIDSLTGNDQSGKILIQFLNDTFPNLLTKQSSSIIEITETD